MTWVISAYVFGIGLIGGYALLLRRRRARINAELERARSGDVGVDAANRTESWTGTGPGSEFDPSSAVDENGSTDEDGDSDPGQASEDRVE